MKININLTEFLNKGVIVHESVYSGFRRVLELLSIHNLCELDVTS